VADIKVCDVDQLAARMAAHPSLKVVDVRTPEEFAEVHAVGVVNVPLSELSLETLRAVGVTDPQAPLHLICRSGARSMHAAQALSAAGFADLVNVAGGTIAWQQRGLPVKSGE
jgi:rhodanese-related sulfurtransferase